MASFELAPVLILLGPSCPSAIARFVVAVVINPVERKAGRALAHVRKKVLEIVPAVANGYAATTMIFKLFDIRVEAAGTHIGPRPKCRAPFPAARVAVLEVYAAANFAREASAGARVSASEISNGRGSRFLAAIANTSPNDATIEPVRNVENGQAAKTLTSEINEIWHKNLLQRLLCQVANLSLLNHGG